MKIVIMGQGYVGLPLAIAAAKAGYQVIGYEPDQRRCSHLQQGHSYVEDISNEQLVPLLDNGTYKPTDNPDELKDFDIAIITVPTPLKKGRPDLSYVEAATTQLALHLREGALVVLESTTYPGTTRKVVVPILESASDMKAGEHFHVGYSPERIDPGNPTWTLANTPKIISGLTATCLVLVNDLYRRICDTVVPAGSLEEAELAKVNENTQRMVNIALANELLRHAHTLNVDVHEVIRLSATKPFGYTPYLPGPGVGGHCLPVDATYLASHLHDEFGTRFRLIELAQEINDAQPGYVARRLQEALDQRYGLALGRAHILALGQAYKPDTADMRESPAVEVVEVLRQAGARVTVVDPHFAEEDIDQLREIPGPDRLDIGVYDAVVLLTPHTEFDLQYVATYATYVLDTRGVMDVAPHIERL